MEPVICHTICQRRLGGPGADTRRRGPGHGRPGHGCPDDERSRPRHAGRNPRLRPQFLLPGRRRDRRRPRRDRPRGSRPLQGRGSRPPLRGCRAPDRAAPLLVEGHLRGPGRRPQPLRHRRPHHAGDHRFRGGARPARRALQRQVRGARRPSPRRAGEGRLPDLGRFRLGGCGVAAAQAWRRPRLRLLQPGRTGVRAFRDRGGPRAGRSLELRGPAAHAHRRLRRGGEGVAGPRDPALLAGRAQAPDVS